MMHFWESSLIQSSEKFPLVWYEIFTSKEILNENKGFSQICISRQNTSVYAIENHLFLIIGHGTPLHAVTQLSYAI